MTTVYRYLGYGTTDSNGVAKLDHDANGDEISHSYTGTGAGEVDVVGSTDAPADISDGSFQSETYSIMDYIVYDTGYSDRDTSKWTNDRMTVTTDGTGTTISRSGTGNYKSNNTITGDFQATIQLKCSGGTVRFGVIDSSSNTSYLARNNTTEMYFEIKRINGVITARYSSDGTSWSGATFETNNVGSNDCKFNFYISATEERSITFHNLTILPL